MRKPLVSVLVPVYNVEKYLSECLESIMAQTMINIEIICVNDGSTDRSLAILEKYRELDSRIIIISKVNGGLPSARNVGIEHASGDFIAFVDSDDHIDIHMLERLYNYANDHNSDIVICGAEVFPEEPHANQWLYDTLSPSYAHYEGFDTDLLFGRIDTSPFLWRTFVRKKLIDDHNLRLNEDIIIGEDKSFQTRLYLKASGITVVPDKLYHYRWYRPDSIMSKNIYNDKGSKVIDHTALISSMADDLITDSIAKDNFNDIMMAFLNWSIPFVYDDFISARESDKSKVADMLIPTLKKAHYYENKINLPSWKNDMYSYMYSFYGHKSENILLSIILTLNEQSDYLDNCINNLSSIVSKNIEFVIVNNGASDTNYLKIQKFLYNDKRVRLFNTPSKYSYAETLNTGVSLSSGSLLMFLEPFDLIKDEKSLMGWINHSEKNYYDICACQECVSAIPEINNTILEQKSVNKNMYSNDFHCFLYNKRFIERNHFKFHDYSILTGFHFINILLCKSVNVGYFNEYVYIRRELYKQDWISTQKCELVLEALNNIVDLSLKSKNPYVHANVYTTVNNDVIRHILVNNTKPYSMPGDACPNGENSQIGTIAPFISIINKAEIEMLKQAGFSDEISLVTTLYDIIDERHKFLANI